MTELNPEHPVTQEVHDHWHKICALLMCRAKEYTILFSEQDIEAAEQVFAGQVPVVVLDHVERGTKLRLRFMPEAAARAEMERDKNQREGRIATPSVKSYNDVRAQAAENISRLGFRKMVEAAEPIAPEPPRPAIIEQISSIVGGIRTYFDEYAMKELTINSLIDFTDDDLAKLERLLAALGGGKSE